MLEGLPPNNAALRMRVRCDQSAARRIADVMVETFDPADVAAAAFEDSAAPGAGTEAWAVEVYFGEPPDRDVVCDLIAVAASRELAETAIFESVTQRDWVASSLAGLKPVTAGRFVVHGAHDRARRPPNAIALEIEAALAFGTGHHGTTRGCLLMLDDLLKRRRPARVLDLGTGSGVLAMAAAKRLKRTVMASDIDPVATRAARANVRLNGLSFYMRPRTARGVEDVALRAGAPYDLILANILARPLRALAPALACVAAPRANVILSGLIARDAPGILSAYAAQGFFLVRRLELEGWTSLLLRRGGALFAPPVARL
jgi:ribosomal protein L11 methyltransferase